MPDNSHFNYNFFVSLMGQEEASKGHWDGNNFKTYYVLREGVDRFAFGKYAVCLDFFFYRFVYLIDCMH